MKTYIIGSENKREPCAVKLDGEALTCLCSAAKVNEKIGGSIEREVAEVSLLGEFDLGKYLGKFGNGRIVKDISINANQLRIVGDYFLYCISEDCEGMVEMTLQSAGVVTCYARC